ncbi:unnamed protein product [Phytomonas sp. Hart1]|nr:unnamed protein product [Phytomonas sp. Hart1]|eukprot:CCW66884.1 unnamed protein product [Phytomonas sp. isolate Hart1]
MNTMQPPPPFLNELWTKLVWPMQHGEPLLIFFIRSLALHFAVTCLSPRFRIVDGSQNQLFQGATARGTFREYYENILHRGEQSYSNLSVEICRVVGFRLQPYYTDLVQSGWELQSCPDCAIQPNSPRPSEEDITFTDIRELPQSYGGDICSRCGKSLPLQPVWTRHFFIVLQRQDGSRCAAVAYGDDLCPQLRLGCVLRALLYATTTEQGEQLVGLHNATVLLRTAEWTSSNTPEAATVGMGLLPRTHFLESFAYQPMESCRAGLKMCLTEWCRLVAPGIVGQDSCKGLLFLSVIHTLYRAVRRGTAGSLRLRPLHVLLVGPTKSGKTALLREIAHLYGKTYAGVICQWHGSVGAAASTAEYGFGASQPRMNGNVLLCGAALESSALMLDEVISSASCLPLIEQLLEDGSCVAATVGSGSVTALNALEELGQSTFSTEVQMIASIHEESRLALPLARRFPLVACVSPKLSLAYSVSIGQNVIAASAARSSSSRCANSRASSSRWSFDGSDNRGSSTGHGPAVPGLETSLDVDTLIEIARCAPDEETLYAALDWPSLSASYLELLQTHRHLLEFSTPISVSLLPMPASQRGLIQTAECSEAAYNTNVNLDHSLQQHLRVLSALSVARLVLQGRAGVCWSADLVQEVWDAYLHHLRSLAHLLDGVAPKAALPPRVGMGDPLNTGVLGGFSHMSGGASIPHSAIVGKRRRTSRKACKLQLVELLRRECISSSSGDTDHRILTSSRIEALYLSLGGMDTMGDSFDVVLSQFQQEGLLIQRFGGWQLTMA